MEGAPYRVGASLESCAGGESCQRFNSSSFRQLIRQLIAARSLRSTAMTVGKKAQGQDCLRKLVVQRHGHAPRRSYNAAEKAAETKVRQAGRAACRERD
jgi:hypothetical protein